MMKPEDDTLAHKADGIIEQIAQVGVEAGVAEQARPVLQPDKGKVDDQTVPVNRGDVERPADEAVDEERDRDDRAESNQDGERHVATKP